ncbi:winged helix-turn-helix domain-containing protein [Streptomonospora arabica]|uniref:Winged helix-turn-helix domain-containing protein n=1 Tax=Streptomonospora arabica TaxID=412417 RepID=A0ABV9SIN9_9ACTN
MGPPSPLTGDDGEDGDVRAERGPEASTLTAGELTLDLRARRAATGAGTADLTAREFALLELPLRHRDQVLTPQLLSPVRLRPGVRRRDASIRALRKKVGAERIETARGTGFRLCG